MPTGPKRPCRQPGCGEKVSGSVGWCDRHRLPRELTIDSTRESSSTRGYDAAWREIRSRHLRIEPTCREADFTCDGPLHVDHIVPLSEGGTNDDQNLRTLCRHHHNRRTARDQGFGRRTARVS